MNLKKLIIYFSFLAISPVIASPVHLAEAVGIGGIQQWITVKGPSEKAPMILFLHGGPGNSAMKYSDQFTGRLQQKFLVVQWDQRQTGKTKLLNNSPVPLTTELFENDAVELIGYLLKRFGQKKIYLIGHSWGGFLGLTVASHHPELVFAYFAISPMVWQEESERQVLAIMKAKGKAENNLEELSDLSSVDIPFADGKQLFYQRKWIAKLMNQKSFSKAFVENWSRDWLPLFNQACHVNFFKEAAEIQCPLYFLVGDADYQTYFKLTEEYYQVVKAPKKDIFWFAHSGHSFLVSGQVKLQQIISDIALSDSPN